MDIIRLSVTHAPNETIKVIKKIDEYYKNFNANVHRGAHQLSAKATEEFENARYLISKYINKFKLNYKNIKLKILGSKKFSPKLNKSLRNKLLQGWRQAIRKTLA